MRLAVVLPILLMATGCTRNYYRNWADKDTYGVVQERNDDPRWEADKLTIYGDPKARFHDPFDPDHEPMPPDDPAANQYMQRAGGIKGYKKWHKNGDAPWIEDPSWRDYLDLDKDGALVLKQDNVVELGVIQSRDYQTQLETLYLSALGLTLNRFNFALQWFLTNQTLFQEFGSTETGINNLTTTSNAGFTQNFAAGGQLLVDFANSYVFQFSSLNHAFVNSNIIIQFTQPLLQSGGKVVAMEPLTEGERSLLYQLRIYMRFRKTFAVQEAATTFLNLLNQQQQISNQRENLKGLDQSYKLHEALLAAGLIDGVKVDQVFQTLQAAQSTLIQFEANLQTSLDLFKISLGLPPSLEAKIDDTLLKPFQLASPEVLKLQSDIDKLQEESIASLTASPTKVKLLAGFIRLKVMHARAEALAKELEGEIANWRKTSPAPDVEKAKAQREKSHQETALRDLEDTKKDLESLGKKIDLAESQIRTDTIPAELSALQKVSDGLVGLVSELYVVQTQIRAYLIKLKPPYFTDESSATQYALENRLDLMNERGKVTDTWRQIAVTANALESQLNLVFNGNLNSAAGQR